MGTWRNRPDRRRVIPEVGYQERALIRPVVTQDSNNILVFTFPATVELVDDFLTTQECCVEPAQNPVTPASVSTDGPNVIRVEVPFDIWLSGGVFWFPFNGSNIVITDGRVLDPTPYVFTP